MDLQSPSGFANLNGRWIYFWGQITEVENCDRHAGVDVSSLRRGWRPAAMWLERFPLWPWFLGSWMRSLRGRLSLRGASRMPEVWWPVWHWPLFHGHTLGERRYSQGVSYAWTAAAEIRQTLADVLRRTLATCCWPSTLAPVGGSASRRFSQLLLGREFEFDGARVEVRGVAVDAAEEYCVVA
jgi:hypothetical protein